MDQLRRIMASINKQLRPMSAAAKVAIGAIVIVFLLALFIVADRAGKSDMVELLPGMPAADQTAAKTQLDIQDIKSELRSGKLMVPKDQYQRAQALLAESGRLSGDKSLMFETLLAKQSWTNSKQQNEQNYLV